MITDSTGNKLPDVSVFTSDQLHYTISKDNGYYKLTLPSDKVFTIFFSYAQKRMSKKIGPLKSGETKELNMSINVSVDLQGFVKYGEKDREKISTVILEAKKLERFPSVTGSIESFVFPL